MYFKIAPKRFLPVLLVFTFSFSFGQGLDVGFGIGGANYDGDLIPQNKLKIIEQTHFAAAAFARFELNQYLAGTTSLVFTQLGASDSDSGVDWMEMRNLSFKTNIIELSGIIEFHPLGANRLSPFVAAGAGIFNFNPKTQYNGAWVDLRPLGTEGQGLAQYPDRQQYKSIALAWMVGGGLRYRINEQMWISADLIGRISTTDYLDDVSKTYVDYYELLNGSGLLAANLGNRTNEGLGISEPDNSQVGNPRGGAGSKDFYFVGLFKFHYRIFSIGQSGRKVRRGNKNHWKKCPTF